MRGIRKGKVKVCLALIPLLVLVMVSCVLSGCKKGEKYRNIRITDVEGDAVINRDDEELEAEEDMNLQSGDELVTEKGARVTLRLDDDKYIVVDEDTKLVLVAEGTKEDSKTSIELEYGAVFSDIKKKLSEESEFEVVTPSSVMSVRGTQFEVVYREIKNEAGKIIDKVMKVLTFDGKVSVKPEGSDEKRTCKAGMMEVLVETADGEYEFAEESREIEAEDLSEFSADYLKDALSEDDEDLSKKEKELRENLLEIIEEFFEEVLPEREKEDAVTPGEDDPSEVTPMPGTEDPEEPPVVEPEDPEEPPVIEPEEPDVIDYTLSVQVYLPEVIHPLETVEVSDMAGLYEIMDPHVKSISKNGVEISTSRQDNMSVFLNHVIDTYIEGDSELKAAAAAVFGKDVVIHCEGFYSENDNELVFDPNKDCTFEEFGVDSSYLTLYPIYTVEVPADNASYRYIPCRLMITELDPVTEDEENTFYTFMVQEYKDMGLPKVGGYDMYWMIGSTKSESETEDFLENKLNWPIMQAEKREGGEAETPAVDENAVFHGVYYFPKLIKNLAELEVTDKESLFDLLDPYRNYMNDYRIWTSKIYEESDFPKEVAEVAKEKKEVLKSAEEYFGEAVEVTCQGFFDTDVEYFYNPYVTVKMSDVKENVKDGDELVFYPVYTITVLSTGETFNFSPVILQIKDGDETREYFVMMEDYMEVQLPELSDVKLTWLPESGDDVGADSSKVEDVLGWKYIGVND